MRSISIIEINIYELPQKWLHIFETFHLASLQTFDHFWTIHLILRSVPEIFDISIWWTSLWLFGYHTFSYKSFFLFPSRILVCATAFATYYHFLFWNSHLLSSLSKNKKSGKIYRHKSMHVSKLSRLLTNHSWQAWRLIYNSHT